MNKAGIIASDESWEGEITVTGDVVIPTGVTVELRPGSSVRFSEKSSFVAEERKFLAGALKGLWTVDKPVDEDRCFIVVQGKLTITGKENSKVSIGNEGWNGCVVLIDKASAALSHALIRQGFCSLYSGKDTLLEIRDTEIRESYCGAITCGSVRMDKAHVHDNHTGIMCFYARPGSAIEDSSIEMNETLGIHVHESDLTICRNDISRNDVGINQNFCSRVKIRGNLFSGNNVSIYCAESPEIMVTENTIEKSVRIGVLSHRHVGILTITKNLFVENACAITCFESEGAHIEANTIAGGPVGIQFFEQAHGIIEKNTFKKISDTAMFCVGMAEAVVADNTIESDKGIIVQGDARVSILRNTVKCRGVAVQCLEHVSGDLRGNTIKRAADSALQAALVSCAGMVSLAIDDNTFSGYRGIEVKESASVTASDNVITYDRYGIDCGEQSHVAAERNEFTESRGGADRLRAAVACNGICEVTLKKNRIKGSRGVLFRGSAHVRAEQNEIECWDVGIECFEQARGELDENTIRDEKESDKATCTSIKCGGMTEFSIKNNVLSGRDGLEVLESANVTLSGNTFKNLMVGVGCRDQSTCELFTNDITIIGRENGDSFVAGIICEGLSDIAVRNNTVSGAHGVIAGGLSSTRLIENRISYGVKGVQFKDEAKAEVISNIIRSSDGPENSAAAAICCTELSEVLIENNEIAGALGVSVSVSAHVKTTDNRILFVHTGIEYADGSHGEICGNKIGSAAEEESLSGIAVRCRDMSDLVIERNVVSGSCGVCIAESAQACLMGNTIVSTYYGVRYEGHATGKVESNTISIKDSAEAANQSAVQCEEMSEVEVNGNTIRGRQGVEVVGSAHAKLAENTIEFNRIGVIYSDQATGVVELNKITNHYEGARMFSGTAIYCGGIAEVAVNQNEMHGSSGISSSESACVNVKDNVIECEWIGVRYDGNTCGKVESNTIGVCSAIGNGISIGVQCEEMSDIEITGNRISGVQGVEVAGSARVMMLKNAVEFTQIGISCNEQSSGEIDSNNIGNRAGPADFTGTAICCGGISDVGVKHNEISARQGLDISESSHAEVFDNAIEFEKTGVFYSDQSNGVLKMNRIGLRKGVKNHRGTAVVCRGMIDLEVCENVMEGSTGIAVMESAHADVIKNRIEGDRTGVRYEGNAYGMVRSNTIRVVDDMPVENTATIECEEMSNVEIRDNRIYGVWGVRVNGSAQAVMNSNVIDYKKLGVYFYDQSSGTLESNTLTGKDENESIAIEANNMAELIVRNNRIGHTAYGIVINDVAFVSEKHNEIRATIARYEEESFRVPGNESDRESESDAVKEVEQPAQSGKNVAGLARRIVYHTRNYPLLRKLYRWFYFVALAGTVKLLKNYCESVYLRRGMLNNDWVPGMSDIDLFAVVDEKNGSGPAKLRNLGDLYGSLKNLLPFLGELQISTRGGLARYLEIGDLRAWEGKSLWKTLYGPPVPEQSAAPDTIKLRCDTISEMLNSYAMLCATYFQDIRLPEKGYVLMKSFMDILKCYRYMNGDLPGSFKGRKDVLDAYMKECNEPWLEDVRSAWSGKSTMSGELAGKMYLRALRLAGDCCTAFNKDVVNCGNPSSGQRLFTEQASTPTIRLQPEKLVQWEKMCSMIYQCGKGAVKSIVLDNPGLLYLIIHNDSCRNDEIVAKMMTVREYIKSKVSTAKTPLVIVTEVMFQSLLFTLHLETPFNYYRLGDAENDMLRYDHFEEHYQSNICRSDYAKLPDALMHALVREAVTVLGISLHMYERVGASDLSQKVPYLVDRILGLRLALEKRMIVVPQCGNVLERYKECYPQHRELIETFMDGYLTPSDMPAKDKLTIYREHVYPFLKETIDGLCGSREMEKKYGNA